MSDYSEKPTLPILFDPMALRKLIVLAATLGLHAGVLIPVALADPSGQFIRVGNAPQQSELLEPDAAFQLTLRSRGPHILLAELSPAKGYYLYKDKIRFDVQTSGVSIASVKLPPGDIKLDKIFGKTEVYRTPVVAEIALDRRAAVHVLKVRATYQGCQEQIGVCYPPIEKVVHVALP